MNLSLLFAISGGPTRQFLSKVWDHIGGLKINDICLFDAIGNDFVLPVHDVTIQDSAVTAGMYYLVVGRIMGYCILHQHTIANHVLVRCSLQGLWIVNSK
jgi:hypothetical protein